MCTPPKQNLTSERSEWHRVPLGVLRRRPGAGGEKPTGIPAQHAGLRGPKLHGPRWGGYRLVFLRYSGLLADHEDFRAREQ